MSSLSNRYEQVDTTRDALIQRIGQLLAEYGLIDFHDNDFIDVYFVTFDGDPCGPGVADAVRIENVQTGAVFQVDVRRYE